MPKDKPETLNQPKYTFGFRRGNALKNQTSCPNSVGPGRYVPEQSAFTSEKASPPRWTLPKAGRGANDLKTVSKNQTYDTSSAFGKQAFSSKKSGGCATFGNSGRDNGTGTFKDMMQSGAQVKLYHP